MLSNIRDEKIKRSIEKEVMSLIVSGGIKDPRVPIFLTITKITLSKDRHYSHIYITLNGNDAEKKLTVDGLNSAKGYIQAHLAKTLQLRFTPRIEFRIDMFEEKANHVDDLLKLIETENDHGEQENNE